MRQRTIADREIYHRLLGYVRPYWRQFAWAIAAMVALAALEGKVSDVRTVLK